jgi:hypothetical protein
MMSRLIRANHPKGWNATLLAYVQEALETVAELPGAPHTTSGLVRRAHECVGGTARERAPLLWRKP